jgi:L-2-hydroxyglutarate oxidase LhgO
MERVDAVVVGAGVVGLAIGRALARRGLETIVLEREATLGTGISSRNSEVIHAGLYDAPGSLKARLCVAGRRALYAYCEAHGVGHRRCGKLVVAATPAQAQALESIAARARANGVENLRLLSGAEARSLEPALAAEAALQSPETGIIDSHGLMLAYRGDLEAAGGMLAVRSPLLQARALAEPDTNAGVAAAAVPQRATASRGFILEIGGDVPMEIETGVLVNSAGLYAPTVAAHVRGLDAGVVPPPRYAKGNYYALAGRTPFSRLVYPVPEPGGLGVHLTLDLAGQARFGPDVEWLDTNDADAIDYAVDPARAERFYAAIRRYWPALPDGALAPAYSGVRPKLQVPGGPPADFSVQGPGEHGLGGLVNLYGIESPGLTASLALADETLARLGL